MEDPGLLLRLLMKIDTAVFFFIMKFARFCAHLLDSWILGKFFGFTIKSGPASEAERAAADYDHSAQVVRLLGRGAYCFAGKHDLDNFFWKHESYVHPRFILEEKRVTLQGITPKSAFFCVTDVDVYETSKAPFAFLLQFLMAKKLVILPLESLHMLAEEVGDPRADRLLFVGNTARCGTTLLCQMLARLDEAEKVLVLSEPWSFVHIHGHYNMGRVSWDETNRLLRSAIRLQCKPDGLEQENKKAIVIKFATPCTPILKMLKEELFPQAKMIFMTRHPKPSNQSFISIMESFPYVYRRLGENKIFWYEHLAMPYEDEKLQRMRRSFQLSKEPPSTSEDAARGYAAALACYLADPGMYDKVMVYEDFLENVEQHTEEILRMLNLPMSQLRNAIGALKKDSQNNMFTKKLHLTDEDWRRIDRVYEQEFEMRFNTQTDQSEFQKLILSAQT